MGSVQQVVTGAICLIAAFAFGSYINNHPPLGTEAEGGSGEVALTTEQLSVKRPEPILTMKHRKAPEFGIEDVPEAATESKLAVQLPDPSDLGQERSTPPAIDNTDRILRELPDAVQQELASPPDFTGLAAEYRRDPLATEPMGNIPRMEKPEEKNGGSLMNLVDRFRGKSSDSEINPQASQPPSLTRGTAADELAATSEDSPNAAISSVSPQSKPRTDTFVSEPTREVVQQQVLKQPATESVTSKGWNAHPKLGAAAGQVRSRFELPKVSEATAELAQSSKPLRQVNDEVSPEANKNSSEMNSVLVSVPPPALGASVNQGQTAGDGNASFERTGNRQSAMPFKLTDQGRSNLVKLRNNAEQKIALESTQFNTHQVRPGETLQSISKLYFGQPEYYLDIYLANRDRLRNPVQVPAGIDLRIPVYQP